MGMTIDRAIEVIEYLKTNNSQLESLDVAIDTMRKYQKIMQIVNSKTTRLSYEVGFKQIKGVLEDGNNN